jgi:hypothetical protein
MALQATHSDLVTGVGPTAAGSTVVLGNITLPAGGPWLIHHVYGLIAAAAALAAQQVAVDFSFRASSGDLTPAPDPNNWPLIASGSALGALINPSVCPLNIYPTAWSAEGKAVLAVSAHTDTIITNPAQLVIGILYGPDRPQNRPFIHTDRVRAAVTSAADTALGTITLPEGATRITGICATAVSDGVLVAGEELIGFVRLTSPDQEVQPALFPLSAAYGAALGATISGASPIPSDFIIVDIPVLGGSRINCFVDLNTAVTNAANVVVTLSYE